MEKRNIKFFLKIIIFIVVLTLSLLILTNDSKANSEERKESKFCYLSDIPYIAEQSRVGWGSITLDQNLETQYNDGLIALQIDNQVKFFIKGVSAHATSTLVYDISSYNYDYFTTYFGVDASRQNNGNGVKFAIYTSKDGQNWDLHTPVSPPVMKGNTNANFIKIDIKEAKYLKLYCHNNGNATADHAVYADAKLIKEGYEEGETKIDFIKTIEEYDEIIKNHTGEEITGEYELTILQREFVKNVGYDILQSYTALNEENEETISWLMNDVENLRLYILGGKPTGSYLSSLKVLNNLYKTYKEDFKIQEISKYGTKKGDLYKKMAITLSLTHSSKVALWMQPSAPENQSDAVTRYSIFKKMYDEGKFVVSSSIDITKWFEQYNVEEMRFVMNNIIDDEEILWLNEYTKKQIDAHPTQAWAYLTPHPYMAYVWPNYGNPIFHDQDKKEYWDEKFGGIFSKYGVSYSTETNKIYKVWMNFRNEFGTGAVCGGISKTGSNIRTVHGIPAAVIGQPGHAAIIYYGQDEQGRGYWNIDNDVSGWTLSEKGERMLLGWGNASYTRGSYQVVYMVLAQEVLNDYENFEKCEKTIMLANSYSGDLEKQEEIYRKALEIQPINIDAWYALINVYNLNTNKTENDYYDLAKELAEKLKYFPLPMQQLTNLIKTKITSIENSYKFTLLQTRILKEASQTPNNTEQDYYVYQPSITRTEANFLLGKLDKTIATFSFDGEDSGKIVLSSRFDGNGIRWDYSLDGKETWNEVSFTAEEEHKLQLTPEQIANITAENDIYVHIVGVGYEEENLYKIDITKGTLPNTLFNNDLENRVVGVNLTMQWRMAETEEWTSYKTSSPNLTGNATVEVRVGATGTSLPSEPISLSYTEDNQPDTRKYIPVSHLTIEAVSTQATSNQGNATYAIDANYNTRWHSAWNGSDTQRYIIIKLDKPVYLSAVEFVPAGGGNGKIIDGTIYGSTDGENWEVLSQQTGLRYTNQANTIADAIINTKNFEIEDPKQVQYVKIVADRASNGNWFTARAFNLFQDITQNPHPTAGIAFSIEEPTRENVVARLVNPSTQITITNNSGNDTYTFTENGQFTFEFVDEYGREGKAIAKVDWIDRQSPTATIEYSQNSITNKDVIAMLKNISEDIYIINEDGIKTNYVEVENNKVKSITYINEEGKTTKVLELDENGNTQSIKYFNDNEKVVYITKFKEDGSIEEIFLNEDAEQIDPPENADEYRNLSQIGRTKPLEHTFEENGTYIFRIQDKAGNSAQIEASTNLIDKEVPTAQIEYDITQTTNNAVTATIILSKENAYVTNNNGNKTYTFNKNGEFTFEFQDEAGNKGTAKAKVNWIIEKEPEEEITLKSKYKTIEEGENKYLYRINAKTILKEFIKDIETNGIITIYKKDGTILREDEFIGTGMILKVKNESGTKEISLTLSVIGDTDGNGEVTPTDLADAIQISLGENNFNIIQKLSVDINEDNQITPTDLADMIKMTLE
ncbi:MAG: hypothetical protein HFJ41_06310 [Clostridia bacterium]|nr:hypothetical protein [Clostridia bacterium]